MLYRSASDTFSNGSAVMLAHVKDKARNIVPSDPAYNGFSGLARNSPP